MESKDRLMAVLEYSKMNAHAFAHHIGVPYQKVIDVKRGQIKKISAILANGIVNKYPNIDINWLITGEGSMYKQKLVKQEDTLAVTEDIVVEKPKRGKGRPPRTTTESTNVLAQTQTAVAAPIQVQTTVPAPSAEIKKLIDEISALRAALIEERQNNQATINRLLGIIEMLSKK